MLNLPGKSLALVTRDIAATGRNVTLKATSYDSRQTFMTFGEHS